MQAFKIYLYNGKITKNVPLHGHESILFPFQMSNYFCYLTIHFILSLKNFVAY